MKSETTRISGAIIRAVLAAMFDCALALAFALCLPTGTAFAVDPETPEPTTDAEQVESGESQTTPAETTAPAAAPAEATAPAAAEPAEVTTPAATKPAEATAPAAVAPAEAIAPAAATTTAAPDDAENTAQMNLDATDPKEEAAEEETPETLVNPEEATPSSNGSGSAQLTAPTTETDSADVGTALLLTQEEEDSSWLEYFRYDITGESNDIILLLDYLKRTIQRSPIWRSPLP